MSIDPSPTRTLRVGLTGGIGSGKSEVARLFAQRGVPVIDADEIARALVAPGQPAYREIVETFGKAVLRAGGEIDRAALRQRVFDAPHERARLEAILHPRVRAEMQQQADQLAAPYCLFVIPLLVETGQQADVDRVLVIDAPEDLQIQRVVARSGLSVEEARKIVAAQASRADRLAQADDVIVNDKDLARLDKAVGQLHAKYSGMARPGGKN